VPHCRLNYDDDIVKTATSHHTVQTLDVHARVIDTVPPLWDPPVTRCFHFTAGCTTGCATGWVNYANEPSPAALERSSQDAYDVIRLTRSKAAAWTVDDVARLFDLKK